MPRIDTSRRQQLAARLKSAIATAALVGTIGGWVAFGTQQSATTTVEATTPVATVVSDLAQVAQSSSTTSGVAQVAESSTSSQGGTATQSSASDSTSSQSGTATQSSASSSQSTSQRSPVTRTRSSR